MLRWLGRHRALIQRMVPAIIQPGSVFSPDVTLLAAKNAKLDLGGVLGGVEGVLGVPEPHPTHTGAGVRPFLARHHLCVLAAGSQRATTSRPRDDETRALLIPMFRMQLNDLALLGGQRALHPGDVGVHLIFGIEH